jgi:purine-binding chemotaxis protein CheW
MGNQELVKELLRKRTELLAKAKIEREQQEESLNVVVFILNNEKYAIGANWLKGIRTLSSTVPLPGVPSFIKGITNLYGVLYSVVDLKVLLGLPAHEETQSMQLMIIDHETLKVAFLVEKIDEFKTIYERDMDASITGIKSMEEGLILGLSNDGIIILNPDKILEKIKRLEN